MKVVCLGDSLTFGYGVGINQCWVEILKSNKKNEVINKGVNGDTTAGLLSRSYRDVIEKKTSNVIMMIGTNDFMCGYSVNRVKENVEELIKEFKKNGIDVVIGVQPPVVEFMAKKYWSPEVDYKSVNDKLIEYREWIKNYKIDKHKIKYIDIWKKIHTELQNNSAEEYYLDGIHLTAKGHKIVAEEINKYFNGNSEYNYLNQ